MVSWREIWYYIRLMCRWWWLLILALIIPMSIAYLRTERLPDYYAAHTALMIGDHFTQATPDIRNVRLSNELALFYQEIVSRKVILQPVSDRVLAQTGQPVGWRQIRDMLTTEIEPHANLLELTITDSDPQRASLIVSIIADQLIAYSPTSPEKIAQAQAVLDEELRFAQETRDNLAARLTELQVQKQTLDSAYDARVLQEQIEAIQSSYDEANQRYLDRLDLSRATTSNQLSVFEPADIPQVPLPSKRPLIILLAGTSGLLMAILALLVFDRLDERWRTGDELTDRLGLVHLGTLPGSQPMLYASMAQATRRERAVRDIYTQILLATLDRNGQTLLISSPRPNRGRSAFTFDLAELFARSGHRVMLVDGDTLVDSESAPAYLQQFVDQQDHHRSEAALDLAQSHYQGSSSPQPTPLANVTLLSQHSSESQSEPPFQPWSDLLQSLQRCADIIIFDGPSALHGPDAVLLAALLDGIVLAVDPARDTRSEIYESKRRLLHRSRSQLLGAVVVHGKGTAADPRHKGYRPRKHAPAHLLARQPGDPERHSHP